MTGHWRSAGWSQARSARRAAARAPRRRTHAWGAAALAGNRHLPRGLSTGPSAPLSSRESPREGSVRAGALRLRRALLGGASRGSPIGSAGYRVSGPAWREPVTLRGTQSGSVCAGALDIPSCIARERGELGERASVPERRAERAGGFGLDSEGNDGVAAAMQAADEGGGGAAGARGGPSGPGGPNSHSPPSVLEGRGAPVSPGGTSKFSSRWCLNHASPSTLTVPFRSPLEAEMARRALAPEAQGHQQAVQKECAVNGRLSSVSRWTAEDADLLQISINSFLDLLALVVGSIQHFGLPPPLSLG
uniref:L antigen family member 3 n=1 Tax=Equus caballus TaxID=9796 RepID=A0A3Q2HP91_HORSE